MNNAKPVKNSKYQIGSARLVKKGDKLTIISSGYSTVLALKATEYLIDQDIKVDLIDLRSIKPLDTEMLVKSTHKTGNVMILDSGNEFAGYSNEILKVIVQNCFNSLKNPPMILAALDVPEPTSHGVIKDFKFGIFEIVQAAYNLLGSKVPINCKDILSPKIFDVPDNRFKGPF
jgi:pyruvate dehydrogenase E1 component beta subunit